MWLSLLPIHAGFANVLVGKQSDSVVGAILDLHCCPDQLQKLETFATSGAK